ncbi:MAG: Adenylate kinase [Parcubacteria group bacterium GW2011_GWA2_31_28]|nr:MAG: Adenylate kinase [Parcubacteria group bacterium GW2011_GWA2_31_28]
MTKTSSKTTAVFLMGFIASGKDTQARLLKEKNGFLIISSNEIIKDNFKTNPDNKDVKLVKDQYYSGILIEPSIIAKWVVEDVRKKYKSGISIVFSGSPRTLYEAENELPEIINFYGQDNVKLFFIDISEKEARKRIKKRLICKICSEVIRLDKYPDIKIGDKCPIGKCNGKVIARELDASQVFEVRIKEYYNRTYPAFEYLKNKIQFYKIDGTKDIETIHKEILKNL